MMPRLIDKVEDTNLQGIMLVLLNSSIDNLTTRQIKRQKLSFALKGIKVLKRERESIGKDFEQVTVTYYKLVENFCLIKADRDNLANTMNEELGIDILKIIDKLNPFAAVKKT